MTYMYFESMAGGSVSNSRKGIPFMVGMDLVIAMPSPGFLGSDYSRLPRIEKNFWGPGSVILSSPPGCIWSA